MIGQTIGNYRILAKLGGGGMGVVYSAEDTRLGRRVAVKFLSEETARSPQALERFEREARAASALNHPNIATVHDIGVHEGRPYLVMELLEGQPLNEKLQGRPLELGTVLDWAIQIADALDAAHAKGIVHRDVKPGNLFVNARGLVKVLDFGLAKLTERAGGDALGAGPMSAGPTVDDLLTSPGVAVGTVSYMSPEQARGEELDARSDLFSFGCVLYEMAAGQRAFGGKTPAVIFHAILERTPTPAHELNPAVPPKLEEILAQSLEKDRDMRYQTAAEFRADLKRLKRDLDSGRAVTSGVSSTSPPVSSGTAAPATTPRSTLLGGGLLHPATPAPPSHAKRSWLGLALSLCCAAALAFALLLYSFSVRVKHQSAVPFAGGGAPFSSLGVTRLTTAGNIFGAAISRDGKYVAYVTVNGFLREGIAMRQISTGSTVELLPAQIGDLRSLAFSPDGSFLYYLQSAPGLEKSRTYYQVPSLGGAPRLVASGVLSDAGLSFDGKRIAYVGVPPGETKPVLLSAPVGEQAEPLRALLRSNDSSRFDHFAWSPDGQTLAFVDSHPDPSGLYAGITTLRVDTGAIQQLGTRRWRGASGGLAWLPDGSGILLNARDQTGKPSQVWFIGFPEGAARQMTSDLANYGYNLSVTGDGKSFVDVQTDQIANLWIAPKGEDKSARQITTGRSDGAAGIAWTPDGKLVYASNSSGSWQLWLTDAEGSAPRQLTSDSKYHVWPTLCRGTGRAYFSSDASGGFQLWSLGLDDGKVRQESNGEEQFFDPDCSPDGSWLAGLAAPKGAPVDVFSIGRPVRMDRETGKVSALFDGEADFPKISPDGKHVVFLYHPAAPGGTASAGARICIASPAGGPVEKSFDVPPAAFVIPTIRWMPNSRAIVYMELRAGATNLWMLPLDGGKPKQLTHFAGGITYNFVWSNDGRFLALSRGSFSSDAVLLTDTR
jgi:serine/threonine protein kinase/Tol biopolymer transport system component